MVDERLSDGRRYPTLDDYTRALEEIRAKEARAAQQESWFAQQMMAMEQTQHNAAQQQQQQTLGQRAMTTAELRSMLGSGGLNGWPWKNR